MVETIECLKELLEKKIPWEKRGEHNNVINITLRTAYRLIDEGKIEPLYKTAKQAQKALNKTIKSYELAETIRRQYYEEYRYNDTPKIAVKWAHITSEVEEAFDVILDREYIHLYRHMPLHCECGGQCMFTEIQDKKNPRKSISKWYCTKCGASVGVHQGTDIPLGIPASGSIGKKRIMVHYEIDRIVKAGMGVDKVYRLLSKKLGIRYEETHAGLFNDKQCEEALKILKEIKGSFNLR